MVAEVQEALCSEDTFYSSFLSKLKGQWMTQNTDITKEPTVVWKKNNKQTNKHKAQEKVYPSAG